jgi:hypothetical protein
MSLFVEHVCTVSKVMTRSRASLSFLNGELVRHANNTIVLIVQRAQYILGIGLQKENQQAYPRQGLIRFVLGAHKPPIVVNMYFCTVLCSYWLTCGTLYAKSTRQSWLRVHLAWDPNSSARLIVSSNA